MRALCIACSVYVFCGKVFFVCVCFVVILFFAGVGVCNVCLVGCVAFVV